MAHFCSIDRFLNMDADAQALPETKANEGGDSEVSQPLVSPSTPQQPTLTAQPSTPFSSKETFRQTLNAGMGGLMDVLVERICTLEALMLEREEAGGGGAEVGVEMG